MRVLLLHPADEIPQDDSRWDLLLDTARAPRSTYQAWAMRTGARVVSLYEYADEIEDLYRTKELLALGLGRLLDPSGIDWWDVCSLMLSPDLQQFMLLRRFARQLDRKCELYATRDSALVRGLQSLMSAPVVIQPGVNALTRLRSRISAVRDLDRNELVQVLQDKFDGNHRVRRLMTRRATGDGSPTILAPSAYVNVSRAVATRAASFPDRQFYLVLARANARIAELPPNIRVASLDGYFSRMKPSELSRLLDSWEDLRNRLVATSEEFLMADAAGVLRRVPSLIRWGLAVAGAWSKVFESENVVECFCADDSNPYSRVPLILARKRRLPTVASHHGALDSRLAYKRPHADVYLVKSAMEHDYTVRVCKVPVRNVCLETPNGELRGQMSLPTKRMPYLVFFTEAYHSAAFREDEIYKDLLPKLLSAAQSLGLELALKLHPFDSENKMRACLRRVLVQEPRKSIHIWSGVMSDERWRNTRVLVTGQSSVALEATARSIPVFLCEWLRDPFSGYQKQFIEYGVGSLLSAAEEIRRIPELLNGFGVLLGANARRDEDSLKVSVVAGAATHA